MNRLCSYFTLFSVILFSNLSANAHQGHSHHSQSQPQKPDSKPELKEINDHYIMKVKPIFEKKCMDCHSSHTRYPWYYSLPGARHWIDNDIQDARHHLDFSDDFPFRSHASIKEDLEAIQQSVSNGSMPPFRYRFLHPDTQLSDLEKKQVVDWTRESLERLDKPSKH